MRSAYLFIPVPLSTFINVFRIGTVSKMWCFVNVIDYYFIFLVNTKTVNHS